MLSKKIRIFATHFYAQTVVKSLILSKQAALLAPKAKHRMILPPPIPLQQSDLQHFTKQTLSLAHPGGASPYCTLLHRTRTYARARRHAPCAPLTPKANNETIINK